MRWRVFITPVEESAASLLPALSLTFQSGPIDKLAILHHRRFFRKIVIENDGQSIALHNTRRVGGGYLRHHLAVAGDFMILHIKSEFSELIDFQFRCTLTDNSKAK